MNTIKLKPSFIIIIIFILMIQKKGFSQINKIAIGFWNVENLYDTINDPLKQDEEFTPVGINKWGTERYNKKIQHLSETISQIGKDSATDGLAVIGLCEIENTLVLNDLVNSENLKSRNYKVIHFEGPDARGIDPAFLYNPKYFKVTKTGRYKVTLPTDTAHKTREQLVVSGNLEGEEVSFIVIHWPSRRGGEEETKSNRIAAADVTRRIVDSLQKTKSKCKIIIMGDLNDDPINESVKMHLRTNENKKMIKENELYNTMENIHKTGIGTISYKDKWNLFDQLIISKSLLNEDKNKLRFSSSHIYNATILAEGEGKYKGQPFRTYGGTKYLGGYSDHFPVYLFLNK